MLLLLAVEEEEEATFPTAARKFRATAAGLPLLLPGVNVLVPPPILVASSYVADVFLDPGLSSRLIKARKAKSCLPKTNIPSQL